MKEHHTLQRKYLVIPDELYDLYHRQDDLSPASLILVAVVHSLSKRSEGCTASNAYLAAELKVSEHQIQVLVRKLIEMKVLVRQSNGEGRALFTYFNHVEFWDPGYQKISEGISKDIRVSMLKHGSNNTTEGVAGAITQGELFSEPLEEGGPERIAKRVINAMMAKRMFAVKPSLAAWSMEIRKLRRTYSKQEITDGFKWYVDQLDDKYIPVINRASVLREKFARILAHKKRHQKDHGRRADDLTDVEYNHIENLNRAGEDRLRHMSPERRAMIENEG